VSRFAKHMLHSKHWNNFLTHTGKHDDILDIMERGKQLSVNSFLRGNKWLAHRYYNNFFLAVFVDLN
jgi:hypothetical protein